MSRTIRGLIFGCMGCAGMALSIGWADTPAKKPVPQIPVFAAPAPDFGLTPQVRFQNQSAVPDPFGPVPAPAEPKKAPSPAARIIFESNWKNVEVGSKPLHFRQGDKPFIWTVKNTGDNPVDVGDDYGFSILPGAEEFIVDVRLVLSVADDLTSTVEVKAARVMTQSELTTPAVPTPARSSVPTYRSPSESFQPPEIPSGGRKAVPTSVN